MDLVLLSGFMLATGYYVNNGSFEGFQPRSALERMMLPPTETLQGNDNIYHSSMVERADAEIKAKADKQFIKLQEERVELENSQTDFVFGNNIDFDTFATIPFEHQKNIIENRGLNADKYSELKRGENFLPGTEKTSLDFGLPGIDRTTPAIWNNADFLLNPEQDQIAIARIQAQERASKSMNGIRVSEPVRDRPILEGEMRVLPKSSDELRIGGKPMNNYVVDRMIPDRKPFIESPVHMPVTKRKESFFNMDLMNNRNTFATAQHKGTLPPQQDNRVAKKMLSNKNPLPERPSPIEGFSVREVVNKDRARKLGNIDTLRYMSPTSLLTKTSYRPKQNLRKTYKNLQFNRLGNPETLQNISRIDDRILPDVPSTIKEGVMYDGLSFAHGTSPYQKPGYDVSNMTIPKVTNKENNLVERIGLATMPNVKQSPNRDVISSGMKPTIKSTLDTTAFNNIPTAMVESKPMFSDNMLKKVSGVRDFEGFTPNPIAVSLQPTIDLGLFSTKKQETFNMGLERADMGRFQPLYSIEEEREKFAQTRQPTSFF